MGKIRVYLLTQNGKLIPPELRNLLVKAAGNYGTIDDVGFGNAYNMPAYLAGEIGENVDASLVIVLEDTDGIPRPRVFFGRTEIKLLIEALTDESDRDSYEIAVELNNRIRMNS